MGSVMYVDSSQYDRDRRGASSEHSAAASTERTLLGKAVRWVADKALNTLLDSFLRLFLEGQWYVRLAGAFVTGAAAGSAVWLFFGTVLASLGVPTIAVSIGLGAAAGVLLGYGGGLLAGAGAGWLLCVLAESVSTELSKDPLGLYFAEWVVWCLSAVVGGLVGWVIGHVTDEVARRSRVAGQVLRVLGRLLLFAAVALVLVRTGVCTALWDLAVPATTTGRVSDTLAVGIGIGLVGAFVAALYLLWCYASDDAMFEWLPERGRFGRVLLPIGQAVVTAMLWTLAIVDTGAGSTVSVTILLTVLVWIVPWALTLTGGAALQAWRRR